MTKRSLWLFFVKLSLVLPICAAAGILVAGAGYAPWVLMLVNFILIFGIVVSVDLYERQKEKRNA